jgi:hypothetical protein
MLRIRDEQVHSLRKSLTQDVEDELFEDVKRYFKERHTYVGDAQTRAAVQHGVERAAHYGFSSLRGWALYVTLAFTLGSHFDKNPLYPWARQNLVDDRDLIETTRTHRFYNLLRRHVRSTRDETGIYNEPILRYPEASLPPYTTTRKVEAYLIEQLDVMAPAHFAEAGENLVAELVGMAVEHAAKRGILSAAGLSIYVPLTFLLGVGFDDDPQFPWAIEARGPRDDHGPESVALRLHAGAIAFRRHCLTFLPQPDLPS